MRFKGAKMRKDELKDELGKLFLEALWEFDDGWTTVQDREDFYKNLSEIANNPYLLGVVMCFKIKKFLKERLGER